MSGQNARIIADGANGTKGDVAITGSSINAAQDASLIAAHDLSITAAQQRCLALTNNSAQCLQ